MSSLPQLPETVISLIEENEDAIWAWVSEQHYAQVVAQAGPTELLVQVKTRFSFHAIEQACAGYHVYAGQQGQAPTHTIGQLCRAQRAPVVVRQLKGWSYEQTAAELRSNSLVRWFVGYGLKATAYSAVTLWRFEQWVKTHQPRVFFTQFLQQIDEDFPAQAQAAQVGDTFALVTRARDQNRTELLRAASHHVLATLAVVQPAGYSQVLTQFDGTALFGQADEPHEGWLKKPAPSGHPDARAERTALAAHHLLGFVDQALTGVPATQEVTALACQRWRVLLAKVLKDEFTFAQDAAGTWVKATLRTEHEKSCYAIGSTVDPEATFRQHGDKCQLGYNVSVAATADFIREISAATGATPDSKGVAPLISAQLEHLGLVPPKLIYDRAAGMPKIFAQVDAASEGQTQLVARLINYSQRTGALWARFGPQAFTIRTDGGLTCPNGQVSHQAYRSGSGEGWDFRFSAQQCQGCPLVAQCRGDKVKPTAKRQVFISDYTVNQRQALTYLHTDAFKQDMKSRSAIERVIACLVRYNGARRATGLGLVNADHQARMAALAFNLKHWAVLQTTKARPKPPPEPDA